VGVGTLLFRAGLLLCPGDFRRRFGHEMVALFRRAAARARLDGGLPRLLAFQAVAFTDLLHTALAERRDRSRGRRAATPKRDHGMFDTLLRDLRFSARSLLRNPAFSTVVVLSLAFGIGANVAIYSLVDAVFLRPLPLRDPQQLVAPGTAIVTYPAYRDFRDRARSFDGLAAWDTRGRRLVLRRGDDVEVVSGVLVSGNYFSVLGVDPYVGRLIGPADDDAAGSGPVVVLGYDLWRRDFASDPDVLGTQVSVNGYPLTVIGVAPQGFRGERLNDVKEMWIPLAMHPLLTPGGETDLDNRDAWWIRIMGRLAPGVSTQQALAELNAIGAQLAEEYPATDSEWRFDEMLPAQTIASISRREDLTRFMVMLAATVGAALLIACANVTNLLLLRAEERHAEIEMRRALGATRGRLVRQLMTESVLLALLGGAAGIAVASAALGALRRFQLPGSIDIGVLGIGVQPSMLALALAISLLTAMLFGVLPAVRGARAGEASRKLHATPARWARGMFVALQVSLSLVLLAGGGLFVRSLVNALTADVGFDARDVLVADVNLDSQGLSAASAALFFEQAAEQLRALPGVEAVSWSNAVPVETRGYVEDVVVEGYEPGGDEQRVQSIHVNMVSSGFFDTIGIPMLRGRALDGRPQSREVVVNETLAALYWPGQNPLGKHLLLGQAGSFEVVGVSADFTARHLGEDPYPYIFAPLFFAGGVGSPRLALRVAAGNVVTADAVRRAVQQVSATVPVTDVRSWSAHIGRQTETQQLGATLLGFFSLVALTLAAVGIYGVISFSVARRTREIGIRAALGARRQDLGRLAVKGGVVPLLVGVAGGILLTLAAGRAIAGFLFDVAPYDAATLLFTVIAIVAVGLLAAWVPARRASKIDPLTALRSD